MLPRLPLSSRESKTAERGAREQQRAGTPRTLVVSELAAERHRIVSRGLQNVDTANHRGVDVSHLFDATPPSVAPPRSAVGSSRRAAPHAASTAEPQPSLRVMLLEEAARISKEEQLPISCLPTHFRTAKAPDTVAKRFIDGDRPSALFPAALPTSRADVIAFIDELEGRLNALKQSSSNGGASTLDRLEILDETFVDLVRQNLVGCVERGVLLEYVRVSIFACVNALIDDAAASRAESAALAAETEAARRRAKELEAAVEELREVIRIKDSATRTQQIHDITVAAKRSKTYVDYATAHFSKHDRERESEEAQGELRRRLFSVQLGSHMKQQETHELYLKALAQIETLQARETEWREHLVAMQKRVETLESANPSPPQPETRDAATDPMQPMPKPPPSPATTLGSPKRSMVNFAVSSEEDAMDDSALRKSATLGVNLGMSFAARRQSQMFERRKSNAAPWRQRHASIANTLYRKPSMFKTDIVVESGTDSDDETKPVASTQTDGVGVDAVVDAAAMRVYLAQELGEGFDEAATDPMAVADLVLAGFLVDGQTNTEGPMLSANATPLVALRTTPPPEAAVAGPSAPVVVVKDPAFEVALRRLVLDKVKARPPKWVITTVSQIISFITEREPVIAVDTDISGLALLYFRTKYGLEKLSDQYIAEFIVSFRQSLYRVRRIAAFARFIGLQRYLALPESMGGGGVELKSPSVSSRGASVAFTESSVGGQGGMRPAGMLVTLPWNIYAHYAFILNTVRKLIPRKSAKELEETDTFELPAFGAMSLIKQCYKKRLSDDALSLLFGALNAYDRTRVEAGLLIPPLVNIQLGADHIKDAWPVDLLMELLAFSTSTIFPDLCALSKTELAAASISGVDDPKMWVLAPN